MPLEIAPRASPFGSGIIPLNYRFFRKFRLREPRRPALGVCAHAATVMRKATQWKIARPAKNEGRSGVRRGLVSGGGVFRLEA